MCSPATCRECGKASYTGCGSHVEQVLVVYPQISDAPVTRRAARVLRSYATWLPADYASDMNSFSRSS